MVLVIGTPVEASPAVPLKGVLAPVTSSSHKGSLTIDSEFRKEATAQEDLEKLCFVDLSPQSIKMESTVTAPSGGSVAEVSCSSSTCSVSGNLSDSGSAQSSKVNNCVAPELDRDLSNQINTKLLKRTTSRAGRSSQRWAADPISHSAVRLTTGCVPIVKGGNILFVSASSKPSWIFPKGGWESDEKMEESALRESFEEAGVIGVLGPKLSEVQYETRKARKRRLETEEVLKRKKEKLGAPVTPKSEDPGLDLSMPAEASEAVLIDTSALKDETAPSNSAPVSDEAFARIREDVHSKAKRQFDETSSIQSDQSSYSQVRMSLFPLYVTSVKSEWPENGRLRRAVPIDEAIDILESRPELQAALKEVKERGLHLLNGGDPSADAKQSDTTATLPSNVPEVR